MGRYFGTDGIRGEANRELTVEKALRLGYALGYYLKNTYKNEEKIKNEKTFNIFSFLLDEI